ncbi:MAG: phytoene desaturase family protein [Planctomycetota bacterium]|nr:phytoene desaturase family protein [Planctomycetota bacterium]
MIRSDSKRIIVVGGGLAGLSSAVELSRNGCDVTLVERNEHLGGKMNVMEVDGFTFDMGPTIITMPDVFRGIVERAGRKVEDYCELIDLDPQWRCFYEDGTVLDLYKNANRMREELETLFPGTGTADGYVDFVNYSRRMYHLSERVFFYRDVGSVRDVMKAVPMNDFNLLKDVMAMRIHSTVGATVKKYIPDPRARQLVEHFLQYVGSSPFMAPAILTLIAAAQVDHGCWYPMGGTRKIARTLEQILRELGTEIILGNGVKRFRTEGDRVCGVELDDGTVLEADAVVSNCDVQRSYRDLDGSDKGLKEQKAIGARYQPACSGVVLYLGLDKQYDHLLHHDFIFSRSPQEEFDDIYTKGVPARDPSLYLAVPSRTDPSQAPEGCESLYILVHTAWRRPDQQWEGPGGLLEQYRNTIIDKLKRCANMPDIEEHIVVERSLTPSGIEQMYNAEGGAIYGLASHGRLSGGFKPRNRSQVYDNLYLTGGSTNPGPGVPMVLMSGVTAAKVLREDLDIQDDAPEPMEMMTSS